MLGIRLTGDLRGDYIQAIEGINDSGQPVVAVDVPSGIDSDSGRRSGLVAVRADVTVSFIGLKQGLFTGDAVDYVGTILFDDLAVDSGIYRQVAPAARLLRLHELAVTLPRRARSSYKNQSGHLLIIGGDRGMAGAPLLAARAALRCGAGLVSVITRPEHAAGFMAAQAEVMVVGVDKSLTPVAESSVPAEQNAFKRAIQQATAIVIGPGLGRGVMRQMRGLALWRWACRPWPSRTIGRQAVAQ